jgi:hypothetical protein
MSQGEGSGKIMDNPFVKEGKVLVSKARAFLVFHDQACRPCIAMSFRQLTQIIPRVIS